MICKTDYILLASLITDSIPVHISTIISDGHTLIQEKLSI